jgi:copper chaperone CopZ
LIWIKDACKNDRYDHLRTKRGENAMRTATIQLESLTCPSCMQKIEAAVKAVPGVDTTTVQVLFNSSKVKLDFNEAEVSVEEIENAIRRVGYEVQKTRVK